MEQSEEVVRDNDKEWLEYIARENTPISHTMFSSQSYFDTFWMNADHGIIVIDDETAIVDANPYFLDLIGSNLADAQKQGISDLIGERFLKCDYVNITAIIKGKQYSYSSNNELKYRFGNKRNIPVKIVATRIPSTLKYPFKHMIIHIYEIKDGYSYEADETSGKSVAEILKSNLIQPWFVKSVLWLVGLIAVLLSLSGDLFAVLTKVVDKF